MAELEDAIAAKDVQAATNLAKKLNLDLAILGALQGQEFKLKNIEKIVNSFMPKKLVDIDNLNEALLILGKMAGIKVNIGAGAAAVVGAGAAAVVGAGATTVANRQGFDPATLATLLNANIDVDALFYTPIGAEGDYLRQDRPVRIEIVDRTSGLIEVVQNAVIQNNRYGNVLTYAGAIPTQ